MVAGHRLAARAVDDDEALRRELVRVEAEDEPVAVDEQLHLRDRRDAGLARDLRRRATPAGASA